MTAKLILEKGFKETNPLYYALASISCLIRPRRVANHRADESAEVDCVLLAIYLFVELFLLINSVNQAIR